MYCRHPQGQRANQATSKKHEKHRTQYSSQLPPWESKIQQTAVLLPIIMSASDDIVSWMVTSLLGNWPLNTSRPNTRKATIGGWHFLCGRRRDRCYATSRWTPFGSIARQCFCKHSVPTVGRLFFLRSVQRLYSASYKYNRGVSFLRECSDIEVSHKLAEQIETRSIEEE
jgi:hypothetical protein